MTICSARNSKGQILPLTALLLTVLVGFSGLAIDAGYFFDYKRRMTTAADSAAAAGAWAVRRGDGANVVTVARNAAATNGFTNGTDNITVTVNRPPTSGYSAGNINSVEVIIDRPHPTFFMRVLGVTTTTVAARAVAGLGDGGSCIHALHQTVRGALTVAGNAVVKASLCDVMVNSNHRDAALFFVGGSCLEAHSINVTGSVMDRSHCGMTPDPSTSVPPMVDPFAQLQAPTWSSCTYADKVLIVGGTRTLSPGVYCNGIHIAGGAHVNFNPGLYIIRKEFTSVSDSILSGTEVIFYIDSGGVNIAGQASISLSAPTSGQWEGILFFQSRSNTTNAVIAGGSNLKLDGVLYFPKAAALHFAGGSETNGGYTGIVANTIEFTGNSVLGSSYDKLAGGSPFKRPMLSE